MFAVAEFPEFPDFVENKGIGRESSYVVYSLASFLFRNFAILLISANLAISTFKNLVTTPKKKRN